MKKREREVFDTAADVFYRKGYSNTSVEDIADALGIQKGSLYYYIESKEDLLFRVLLDVHEDAKAVVTETAVLDVPPLERLRIYVQRHVEYNVGNLPRIALFYHDLGLLTPKRKTAIIAKRSFYETFVRGLVEEAQNRGEVDSAVDPVAITNAVFGLVNWIYVWYDPKGSVAAEYLGKLYAEIAVRGISSSNMREPQLSVRRSMRAKKSSGGGRSCSAASPSASTRKPPRIA